MTLSPDLRKLVTAERGAMTEAGLLPAIVYTELGNRLFGTVPLPVEAWLFALPFALLLGVAEELRKGVLRWARRRSDAAPARH